MKRDPFREAEQATGLGYKEDKFTETLGLMNYMRKCHDEEAILSFRGDSRFGMTFAQYLELVKRLGFREVLCDEFVGKSFSDPPAPKETIRVFWRDDGLMLTAESYCSDRVNTTHLYFNLRKKPGVEAFGSALEGCNYSFHKVGENEFVCYGSYDARKALALKIEQLTESAVFVNPWVERGFLWLLTYMDTKDKNGDPLGHNGYDHHAITEGRISRLPDDVRRAITPEQPG
jgi:hypothetical protein